MKKCNKKIGNLGENLAEKYLKGIGYVIIERNFRCKNGEIDIIAMDKRELVFVEVKTRTELYYGKPAEAVNYLKQKRMYWSAEYYLFKNNKLDEEARFDVIEVYLKGNNANINHIKNAVTEKIM